ncbi:MAG: c-type cytochrome [Verrucomicrobiae bacterium]|nr:c-type cytochrome [Verrucomicrobiae bacterium]
MKTASIPVLIAAFASLAGLVPAGAEDSKGFRFPGGEVENGREAFIALNCIQCHTVAKTELPDPKTPRRIELNLGGQLRFATNYEKLVVAMTNPRHVVAEQYRAILTRAEAAGGIDPVMPDLTRDMSARQLMDLAAFLDSAYKAALPDYGK